MDHQRTHYEVTVNGQFRKYGEPVFKKTLWFVNAVSNTSMIAGKIFAEGHDCIIGARDVVFNCGISTKNTSISKAIVNIFQGSHIFDQILVLLWIIEWKVSSSRGDQGGNIWPLPPPLALSLSLEPVQIHPNSSKFIQNHPQTKVISPPIQNWPWQASNDRVWSWNQHLVNQSPAPWAKPHRCIFSNSKMSFGQTTKYSKSHAASSHLF